MMSAHADVRLSAVASACAVVAAIVVAAAWTFQLIGGYEPCALCLWQRQPYYYGIPLALLAAAASAAGAPRWIGRGLLALFGAAMLIGFGLAVYHAGVEWRFWEGPSACAGGAAPGDVGAMLRSLEAGNRAPSCTDATWRFLGLSFAGWNAVASLPLALVAFATAVQRRATRAEKRESLVRRARA